MPGQRVTETNVYYEAYGKGNTVVYLQSPFGGLNPGAYYFAGRLSGQFRVMIWDGPNNGRSDVIIRDFPSEYHLYCYYLKGLLEQLNISSVHLAGCSGGGEMALLFAHLYPNVTKSIALYRPTDTTSSIEKEIVKARYYDIAKFAQNHSMEEVIAYSENPPSTKFGHLSKWIAALCRKDRQQILEMKPERFSEIMTSWGDWMGSPAFYRANLSDGDLREITVPVLIAPCSDDCHPERLAVDLHEHLPGSTYVPSAKHRTEDEIYDAGYEEHPFGGFVDFVNEYERFLSLSADKGHSVL